jgi:glyoxylase-like metal-dependent hydrolase (beta-lactamase superfamily II)
VPAASTQLLPDLHCVRDTCNVYVVRRGTEAVLVDFGSGAALDVLPSLGIERVTDVLVTHHHRDQAEGLARAAEAGARIWVPPVERDLFTGADELWRARRLDNTYETKQEALTLLRPVPVTGTVDEYRSRAYGAVEVYTLPTPGHTMGSVTYLVQLDGRLVAFCGDLLAGPGKLWSLAATQWSYSGVDGQASMLLSLGLLARQEPELLLPSHGDPIEDPQAAIGLTQERVDELVELRRVEEAPFPWRRWLDDPWVELTPHVLLNRTSFANCYAVLSESGEALLVDWGYDLWTGWPAGGPRHACRPLLASIDALKRDHGVQRVAAVVTTHYHDDHVAGVNLLRDVEAAEVWSPENVAPILEHPERYDLPCLWFDAVPVDRTLRFGEDVRWNGIRLAAHPLPGHTRYAAAIELEVDGKRILATGDEQSRQPDGRMIPNYQYRNRFAIDDFVQAAELYRRLEPDLILTGHWGAHPFAPDELAQLARDGERVAELHRELLAVPDAEGIFARLTPYRSTAERGGTVELVAEVRNPFGEERRAALSLAAPDGWTAEPAAHDLVLAAGEEQTATFELTVGGDAGRTPVGLRVALGDLDLGEHAEAVVTVA